MTELNLEIEMTLESTLDRIAVALETIAKAMPVQSAPVAAAKVEVAPAPKEYDVPVLIPTPVAVQPAPTPIAPASAPAINLVPATPAPVTASPSDCPIKDGKTLMETMMALYKELGPQKGAAIQGVLKSVGCEAVNEVRPDQYAAIWAGLQALKA